VGTLKEDLVSLDSGDCLRFAPHDSEWIREEVIISHEAIEGGHVMMLKGVAPFDFDLPDFVFGGDYWW
jgi:hypothetical protein